MSACDFIIKTVADRLSKIIRSNDLIGRMEDFQQAENMARIGGDEFTMLLSGFNSMENTPIVSKTVLETINSRSQWNEKTDT